jgi:hypothetical protein
MVNCRGFEPTTGRGRGGQRSGHTKYMPTQLSGALPIQDITHLATTIGIPVPHPGDMAVPLSSGGSFELFDATGASTGTGGTAGDTMTCACFDASDNAYVGVITAAGNLVVYKVARAGVVVWGPITLATGVGAAPAGIFGMAWDGASNVYVLGTGASLSPVLRIWKLATSSGAIIGGTYLTSETSASAIRDQSNAQPSLNVLAFCSGFLLYPSAAHVLTLYNISTAAKTTIDLGATNYGTAFLDCTSDGNSYFYCLGYTSGGPVSGLAKISTLGNVVFNIQTSTVVYSLCYDPAETQLGLCNTTTFATASVLTGLFLASITVTGSSKWAVTRLSGVGGGFNTYAKDTSNNFAQISTALTITIPTTTLVANAINAGVATCNQTEPTALSGVALRILGVSGGKVAQITPAGPVAVANGQCMSSGVPTVASAVLFGNVYYTDGISYNYYDSPTASMKALIPSQGSLPTDAAGNCGRIMVVWRERLVISGLPLDSANWFMSAKGDPTNWGYFQSYLIETQAVEGNNSDAGSAPDAITCLIPYGNQILLFGLDHSIYQMTDDPMAGGRLDLITSEIGIAFGQPWCRDGSGTLYFMSSRGSVYEYAPGALPQRISDPIIELLEGVIDFSQTIVRLVWDERQKGFMVYISPTAGGATFNYWWDARAQGWFQDTYAMSTMQPFAVHELQGFTPQDRVILIGSQDGYVRFMDPAAQDDDGTVIGSSVFIGPLKGKSGQPAYVADLQCVLGASSGSATWALYSGNNPQDALTRVSPFTGTFAAGRNRSQAVRGFGHAHYVKLANVAGAHTSWQLETLMARMRIPDGKTRERVF